MANVQLLGHLEAVVVAAAERCRAAEGCMRVHVRVRVCARAHELRAAAQAHAGAFRCLCAV